MSLKQVAIQAEIIPEVWREFDVVDTAIQMMTPKCAAPRRTVRVVRSVAYTRRPRSCQISRPEFSVAAMLSVRNFLLLFFGNVTDEEA